MDDNELMTAVRERFDPVRMRTPAETIATRGRSLRHHRRGALAGGALAVALGVGLAVPALTAGTAASAEHATLAAWTVDHRPDGAIAVTIRELRDLPALQREINAAGARVTITEQNRFPDEEKKACEVREQSAYSAVEFEGTTGKYFFILHPAKILPQTLIEITVITGIRQPPGAPSPAPLTRATSAPAAMPSGASAIARKSKQYSPVPTGIGYAYAGDTPSVIFTPVRDVPSCVS
jgi:hypothetical protein